MIELAILLTIIVALWKFSGVIDSTAKGAETTAEVWAEGVTQGAVLGRVKQYKEFKDKLGDSTILSHKAIMDELHGK